jgi:hypothetical protein
VTQRLWNALDLDLAFTADHARRWHGISMETLYMLEENGTVNLVHTSITNSVRAEIVRPTTMVCRVGEQNIAERPDWRLRHFAALAEIRQILKAGPTNWKLQTHENPRSRWGGFIKTTIPDAIWKSPLGKVAIEFDAGSHTLKEVGIKFRQYGSEYQRQWWYAPTAERAESLRTVFESKPVAAELWRVSILYWIPAQGVTMR